MIGLNEPEGAKGCLAMAREWNARHAKPFTAAAVAHTNSREKTRRLRVGYVSPDFRYHSVAYFSEPIFRAHDRDQFELFGYAEIAKRDETTQRFERLADHWRETFAGLGLATYAVHPGWADTAGVQTSLPTFRKILLPILRNPKQGADTIIWLAARRPAQEGDRVWFDRKSRTTHAYPATRQPRTTIPALVERLKADCARVTGAAKAD